MATNFKYKIVILHRDRLLKSLDRMMMLLHRSPLHSTLTFSDYHCHETSSFTASGRSVIETNASHLTKPDNLVQIQRVSVASFHDFIRDNDLFNNDEFMKMSTSLLSEIRYNCKQLNNNFSSNCNVKDPFTERWLDDIYDLCEDIVDQTYEFRRRLLGYRSSIRIWQDMIRLQSDVRIYKSSHLHESTMEYSYCDNQDSQINSINLRMEQNSECVTTSDTSCDIQIDSPVQSQVTSSNHKLDNIDQSFQNDSESTDLLSSVSIVSLTRTSQPNDEHSSLSHQPCAASDVSDGKSCHETPAFTASARSNATTYYDVISSACIPSDINSNVISSYSVKLPIQFDRHYSDPPNIMDLFSASTYRYTIKLSFPPKGPHVPNLDFSNHLARFRVKTKLPHPPKGPHDPKLYVEFLMLQFILYGIRLKCYNKYKYTKKSLC